MKVLREASAKSNVVVGLLTENGAILVNRAGNRFVNEMDTRDVVSAAIRIKPAIHHTMGGNGVADIVVNSKIAGRKAAEYVK